MPVYSGKNQIAFCRRLGNDWQELAIYLDIPAHRRQQFQHGRECFAILEWLEERKEMPQKLSEALKFIKRDDLLFLFEETQRNDNSLEVKNTQAGSSFDEVKKALIKKRLAHLTQQYEAVFNQREIALSDRDKLVLTSQLEQLETQIQQTESELNLL